MCFRRSGESEISKVQVEVYPYCVASLPAVRLRTRLPSFAGLAGVLADAAGTVTGTFLRLKRLVPGLAGGAGLSVGLGEGAGHVFGHGLTPWVALTVAGVFALALDRRL